MPALERVCSGVWGDGATGNLHVDVQELQLASGAPSDAPESRRRFALRVLHELRPMQHYKGIGLIIAHVSRRVGALVLIACVVAAVGCAPPSLLLRRDYGPLGIEVEIWRLRDGTCERRAFVGPYFYRGVVECPKR